MNANEPVAPRTAWMNSLRDEALRMDRPEISKVVHIGWVIASYANSDGTNADPATATIATVAGCSDETVSRAKKVLKALGVLEEQRRPNSNSVYRLVPLEAGCLDWDVHMNLYTDNPQARHKKRVKEQKLAEQMASGAAEPAAGRTPLQNGVRNPSRNGVHDRRPPLPAGSPEAPGPVHGPALAPVPTPSGRTRRTTASSASTQPPLLLAVPGHDEPATDDIRHTLAEHGVPEALRLYGRERVTRELAAGSSVAPYVPPELTVPCGYCEAPPGGACRNSAGLRGTAHEARMDAWAIANADCPDCKATVDKPCTGPDGAPQDGIHRQRAELGAQMRAVAERQPRTETGT
ncbi:zinc finger domain-containing protein [Streptomyces cylindrosporus]|uniref:Helix-turn-helix domain-containing protein n=1 Tax=Streptomyces cylindrosporus TaxID=2927583 RepID=A0ABS9YLZ4_9ACTN|nr:helix-turn-helix domain-containing protein [Streptomyces cylindrosporus]MCI3277570.1 helix-turn-helix domain-containing protein [Streptomyces cylindrosporus]